ncbi:hypothetical protein [Providencia manganoxydans]|uniref:hypothetical protein n=1 Tax=Providencia manganoxydans TaxID=2923283 RepID=UPI0034E3F675
MKELLISLGNDSLIDIQLDGFKYDLESLSLTLSRPNKSFTLSFEWVYSFRVTGEGNLLKMQENFDGKMTTGVYKVENSSYLKWFHEQSENIHDDVIEHYLIVTIDDVIEVITSAEPSVQTI